MSRSYYLFEYNCLENLLAKVNLLSYLCKPNIYVSVWQLSSHSSRPWIGNPFLWAKSFKNLRLARLILTSPWERRLFLLHFRSTSGAHTRSCVPSARADLNQFVFPGLAFYGPSLRLVAGFILSLIIIIRHIFCSRPLSPPPQSASPFPSPAPRHVNN